MTSRANETGRSRAALLALIAILLLGAGIRLWGLFHDLPFSYFGDELHFMKRSMAMGTGDLNPHWFHKPAFFMYVWFLVYGLYFAAGLAVGWFDSTAQFGAHFLTSPGPFLLLGRLVVFACGVATIWVVYQIGRRVFSSERAGLTGALAIAVMAPAVTSSQHMKTDVPAGLLMALSLLVYLRTREDLRWRPLVLAAVLAGIAMGTHYYAIVLVPTFAAMELWNALAGRVSWRNAIARGAAAAALFVLAFFVASPFNFLDPTWIQQNTAKVQTIFFPSPTQVIFEPDSKIAYAPGTLATYIGASEDFFSVLTGIRGMSVPLAVLALVGFAAALMKPATRWYAALAGFPVLIFFFAAITFDAYHVQPRHLNALYPLLATMVWPGALLFANVAASRRMVVAAALVVLASVPTMLEAARWNREVTRLDSRLVSYRWIVENLPPDSRILLDDYGPALQPAPPATARQQALLNTIGNGPFTQAQGTRLQLLRRYPPEHGFNIDELGHAWWLPAEKTDAELRTNAVDLDMGNPLVTRRPGLLDDYRAQGIRYVITNSEARGKYFGQRAAVGAAFPSFTRFYRSLDEERLVRTFDPARWGGKGPIVWIYDLTAGKHGGKTAE